MKAIKKILAFAAIFAFYFIAKEFIELYVYLNSINQYLGYASIILIAALIIYFVIIPIYKIFSIPVYYAPETDESQIDNLISKRIERFKKNEYLKIYGLEVSSLAVSRESYDSIVYKLSFECSKIRKRYVNQLFYSTSISQNGFIDAVLILSASVNIVKEIFILYNGRVSNKDLWIIAKKVYYSVAIGGSEGIAYASDEVFSKFATDTMKSIPFLDKVLSSLADGFVNAALLTRISIITENYCKTLYIRSEKDLLPSPSFIISTTKDLISELIGKINTTLLTMVREKTGNLISKAINPVAVVLDRSVNSLRDSAPVSISKDIVAQSLHWVKSVFKSSV
jgi:hypothetical protein